MSRPDTHRRGDPVHVGTDPKGRDVWQLTIRFPRDESGTYPTRRYNVHGTITDARRRKRDLESERDRGLLSRTRTGTLGAYLDGWKAGLANEHLSPRYVENIHSAIKCHLGPDLGHHKLEALSVAHVEAYLAARRASGASVESVTHERNYLSKALRHAVATGLLPRNVARDARWRHMPDETPRRSLSEDETSTLLRQLAPDTYAITYTAVTTGLRRGELLALTWDAVSLVDAQLVVRQSLTLGKGKILVKPPKTPRSRRTVSLSKGTVAVLREQHKAVSAARLKFGDLWADHDLVFPSLVKRRNVNPGRWRYPDELTRAFTAEAKAAGFPDLTFHDLRHTHGTHLIRAGVPAKVVSERLGHASVAFTLQVYVDVLPDTNQAVAEAVPAF